MLRLGAQINAFRPTVADVNEREWNSIIPVTDLKFNSNMSFAVDHDSSLVRIRPGLFPFFLSFLLPSFLLSCSSSSSFFFFLLLFFLLLLFFFLLVLFSFDLSFFPGL
jgi:hypothetical protein